MNVFIHCRAAAGEDYEEADSEEMLQNVDEYMVRLEQLLEIESDDDDSDDDSDGDDGDGIQQQQEQQIQDQQQQQERK